MASYKCNSCGRWTLKDGCELEQTSYWKFRDCMLDKSDSWVPRQEKEEIRDAELQKHIDHILDGQQG